MFNSTIIITPQSPAWWVLNWLKYMIGATLIGLAVVWVWGHIPGMAPMSYNDAAVGVLGVWLVNTKRKLALTLEKKED